MGEREREREILRKGEIVLDNILKDAVKSIARLNQTVLDDMLKIRV
jgi:hypothetical protein